MKDEEIMIYLYTDAKDTVIEISEGPLWAISANRRKIELRNKLGKRIYSWCYMGGQVAFKTRKII